MELRLEHLVKDFSGTKAVNDVSITIQDGKLTGLLGPSGCGKSTTLYLISGLESPTSGRIFFGDRDVTALPPEKRGIGLVFQNYALYPHLTVEQNIAFPLVNHKEGKEEIRRRTLEMARLVQIEDLLKRKPGQLSGGQQQRVAIARALVKRPDILLLDEPLSNLDARLRLEMREEIRRIQTETGVTTVFVTHDQEEAMSITDEIVLMRTGVVQQQCPPQQMYLNPANRFVAGFLGNPPINFFRLDVCGGTVCLAEDYMLRVHGAADGPVLVGIRPEAWRLGQGLRTAAEAVEMRGKDLLVTFSLAGERARAILDITAGVAAGDAVELTLEPRLVYIFDTAGCGGGGMRSPKPARAENPLGNTRRSAKAYLYLLPAFAVLAVFVVYPILMTLRMGFYQSYVYLTDTGTGFGLNSFRYVLQDPAFGLAVRNTMFIVLVGVPITIVLSLGAALLINSLLRTKGLFQTLYFLPYVTSTLAIGLVFRWLFHSEYGYINFFLEFLGLEPQKWLSDPNLTIVAVTIFTIWSGMAFKIVLFLAGLQKIDQQYYKAARIDGTPAHRIFFRITMPLLSPTFWMVTIVSVIHAFKTYNEVYAMFSRESAGPGNSAITMVYYIYDMFFNRGQVHYASAAAIIFLAIVLALTVIQKWVSKRFVYYV